MVREETPKDQNTPETGNDSVTDLDRPKLLDLFCGAGGAAMGYSRAGFAVTGVDILPQPRFPFTFHQGDALEYLKEHGHEFDVIHASPPCQVFSALTRATKNGQAHLDLIEPTRLLLEDFYGPWIIENVPGAPLINPVLMCGPAVGLEIVRHRLFESNMPLTSPGCVHDPGGTTTGKYVAFRDGGKTAPGRIRPPRGGGAQFRSAMGTQWMRLKENRQAIPPAYTEYLGAQLREALS